MTFVSRNCCCGWRKTNSQKNSRGSGPGGLDRWRSPRSLQGSPGKWITSRPCKDNEGNYYDEPIHKNWSCYEYNIFVDESMAEELYVIEYLFRPTIIEDRRSRSWWYKSWSSSLCLDYSCTGTFAILIPRQLLWGTKNNCWRKKSRMIDNR